MVRCLNIDWLEVFCLEDPLTFPHDAEFFRQRGWDVREREYGTPVYKEMFTLFSHEGEPLIEVRRAPKSAKGSVSNGVLDPMACHVRLTNRSCYFAEPAKMLQAFLEENGFAFQRISRIDLCLDFVRFDSGDYPQKFVQRYMSGKYTKINQANLRAYGRDEWASRQWNSLAWGALSSMIGTKLYCKSLELAQKADKPYIRQSWLAAGLVDDSQDLWKVEKNGAKTFPDIWRLEFSIKSGTKKWFVVEDYNGAKKKIRSFPNTLDVYFSRHSCLRVFSSLVHYYFHFKKYRDGLRKDRCEDKLLFNFDEQAEFYHLENVSSSKPRLVAADRLLAKILHYRETHLSPVIYRACNVLIESLEKERRLHDVAYPWPEDEILMIQRLIADRVKNPDKPFSVSLSEAEALKTIECELF